MNPMEIVRQRIAEIKERLSERKLSEDDIYLIFYLQGVVDSTEVSKHINLTGK